MGNGKSVLFGVDDSDFARQALAAAGGLLKGSQNLHMTLFHGASEPDFSLFSESIGQDPHGLEKLKRHWRQRAEETLEQAKASLTESGFDPNRISTIFDHKCSDPSAAMLKLAGHEGMDTLAVARWGKATVSRQVIGSVTHRLSQLADNLALWVIDPRICSHNVLLALVGAPVSRRVVDYAVRYFSHLKGSKFTLMHVTPPIPPQYWESADLAEIQGDEKHKKIIQWLQEYTGKVKETADDAKTKLIEAGIPEQNIVFRMAPQKIGIARDICLELEEGNHGILVIGRKGYKDIKDFSLGSKAYKILLRGRAFMICLVN